MEYQKASQIRKKSLLTLIGEKKFEQGKGLGSSIGGAISDKFKAKATGIKESLDPLNWLSSMVGQGGFGRMATTAGGRMMGKSDEDIKYFGGYAGKKKKKGKKDPQITSVGAGAVKPLQVGDSIADILGKMYNFMEKTHEIYKLNYEIETAFRQEQMDEDERRHKKLIESITGKKVKPEEKDGVESFIEKLLDGIKKAISPILKIISGVVAALSSIASSIVESVLSVIAKSAMAVVGLLTTPLSKLIKLIIGNAFRTLASALTKSAFSLIGGSIGIVLATLAGGAAVQSVVRADQETRMGPEAVELERKHAEELMEFEKKHPGGAQTWTREVKAEEQSIQARQRDETRAAVERFESESLIPAMADIGFKPTGKRIDLDGKEVDARNPAGELEFINDEGKQAGRLDFETAVNSDKWLSKLLMKQLFKKGEKVESLEDMGKATKTEIKTKVDEVLKPLQDVLKREIPQQLSEDEILQKSLGKNEQIINQNSTNVIGQKSPAVINVNGVRMRDSSTQDCVRKSTVPC